MTQEPFGQISADRYGYLAQLKQSTGRKIIGCMPMYLPEELFHAAGLLPVVALQGEERIGSADAWIQSFFCEWARTFVQDMLNGSLSCFDGLASMDTCHTVRGVSQIARKHSGVSNIDCFFLPASLGKQSSRSYLLSALESLKGRLESYAGRQISDSDLSASIQVYNEMRTLLDRLYQVRRRNPAVLSAQAAQNILVASMTMPKEDFNRQLSRLVKELEDAAPAHSTKVRLLLSGSLCTLLDPPLLELIDSLGIVVDDDLYVGSRYFSPAIAKSDRAPLEALADRYENMIPCSTRHNKTDLAACLIDKAKASGAQAVVSIVPKFCEPHAIFLPRLERELAAAGIPHYAIETVAETGLPGQLKTRLEAFVETINEEV